MSVQGLNSPRRQEAEESRVSSTRVLCPPRGGVFAPAVVEPAQHWQGPEAPDPKREVEILDWNPEGLRGAVRSRAGVVTIRHGKATGHLLAILVWKEGLHDSRLLTAGTAAGGRRFPGSGVANTGTAVTNLWTI